MKIYRIVREKYKDDLSGEGARANGGRWNKVGDAMVYFSEHLSLCALEVIVHMDNQFIKNDFYFMEVNVPEHSVQFLNEPNKVIKGWNNITLTASSQQYGSDWLQNKKSLVLSVPSVIIPLERNILINPSHKLISELKILQVAPLEFDRRMIN